MFTVHTNGIYISVQRTHALTGTWVLFNIDIINIHNSGIMNIKNIHVLSSLVVILLAYSLHIWRHCWDRLLSHYCTYCKYWDIKNKIYKKKHFFYVYFFLIVLGQINSNNSRPIITVIFHFNQFSELKWSEGKYLCTAIRFAVSGRRIALKLDRTVKSCAPISGISTRERNLNVPNMPSQSSR